MDEFQLQPFHMNLQSLERTFADKVFAVCDYYMSGKIKRNSRHIYDLYMLLPQIVLDENYGMLIAEIRAQRAKMPVCISAQDGVNIPDILKNIIQSEAYRLDYEEITTYFQNQPIGYETAIRVLNQIIESKLFE